MITLTTSVVSSKVATSAMTTEDLPLSRCTKYFSSSASSSSHRVRLAPGPVIEISGKNVFTWFLCIDSLIILAHRREFVNSPLYIFLVGYRLKVTGANAILVSTAIFPHMVQLKTIWYRPH